MVLLRQLLGAAMVSTGIAAAVCADTIHVPKNHPTIQDAILAASHGDEIVVAPGTYTEAIDFFGKAVHLRSSDGPETTVIDASGLDKSVVTCVSGEGAKTILEGFTITGGNAVQGGGMNNVFSSPTVIDCIFEANAAVQGGAIRNSSANPTITGSIFRNNTASQNGGAISNTNSVVSVTDCQFLFNSADVEGGAIYNVGNSSVTVTGSRFEGNNAQFGGAIYGILSDAAMADNFLCQNSPEDIVGDWDDLGGNVSPDYCAVIHVPADFATIQSAIDAVVSSAHILVEPGTYPEAIDLLGKRIYLRREAVKGDDPVIIDATGLSASVVTIAGGEGPDTILENLTLTGGEGNVMVEGGPVERFGGGILIYGSSPVIESCIVSGNSAQYGGGIFVQSGSPAISNSVIDGNTAVGGPTPLGGGIALVDATPSISGCSIENNVAGDGGGIFGDLDSLASIESTVICDNTPNNLATPWDDLGANTICVDILGDLNGDGSVDVSDLLLLFAAWGACPKLPASCPADLNGDGAVDVSDLLILFANWG